MESEALHSKEMKNYKFLILTVFLLTLITGFILGKVLFPNIFKNNPGSINQIPAGKNVRSQMHFRLRLSHSLQRGSA